MRAEPQGESARATPQGESWSAEPQGESWSAEPQGESDAEPQGESARADPQGESACAQPHDVSSTAQSLVPFADAIEVPDDDEASVPRSKVLSDFLGGPDATPLKVARSTLYRPPRMLVTLSTVSECSNEDLSQSSLATTIPVIGAASSPAQSQEPIPGPPVADVKLPPAAAYVPPVAALSTPEKLNMPVALVREAAASSDGTCQAIVPLPEAVLLSWCTWTSCCSCVRACLNACIRVSMRMRARACVCVRGRVCVEWVARDIFIERERERERESERAIETQSGIIL